jgi:glycosyltransferase involved in cell wall biosynthesis
MITLTFTGGKVRLGILLFPYVVGGVEQFILRLVPHLRAAGYIPEFLVLEEGPTRRFFHRHGYSVSVLSAHPGRLVDRTRAWLRRRCVGLMMTACYQSFAAEASRLSGIPHVWRCGGMVRVAAKNLPPKTQKHLITIINLLSDRIIVNSDPVARQFAFLSGEKVVQIPNGIGLGAAAAASFDLRRRFGWDPRAPVTAMIGHLVPVKRHSDFILAAARLHRRSPEFKFVIFGRRRTGHSGWVLRPYEDRLRRLVRDQRLNGDFVFVQGVTGLSGFLPQVDLVVHPGPDEGFPNALLEAMAAAKPVVAAASGGCKDLIQDGKTGLLVPPARPARLAEAMESLLTDRRFSARLAKQGRECVRRNFDIRKVARAYVELFDRVLAEHWRGVFGEGTHAD